MDGDIKIEAKKASSYGSYPLRIGRHCILMYENEEGLFDLRCDNMSFEALTVRNRYKRPAAMATQYEAYQQAWGDQSLQEPFPDKNKDEEYYKYDPYIPNENVECTDLRRSKTERYKSPEISYATSYEAVPKRAVIYSYQANEKPVDLVNAPYAVSTLPMDIFIKPLSAESSQVITSSNPFEEDKEIRTHHADNRTSEAQKYMKTQYNFNQENRTTSQHQTLPSQPSLYPQIYMNSYMQYPATYYPR